MRRRIRLRAAVSAGLLGLATTVAIQAQIATNKIDFNTDPLASGLYVEVGATASEWRANGGATTGGTGDGYLSITDARGGQRATLVFKDLEPGKVVKAFSFECDLRIGGGTARPADGFSLNYVAGTDPIVTAGSPYAGTGDETDLPEEGSLTGLGIGFDTWQSGNHPGGIVDVVGVSIRVNGALITQLPVPLQPGNVWPGGTFDEVPYRNLATNDANYAKSMQTGALNTTDDLNGDGVLTAGDADAPQPAFGDPTWDLWIKNLRWEKFRAEIDSGGHVKLFWKGVEVTPAGGLDTGFTPMPGRLVFGGRTGGAWEATHMDNITLVTEAADNVIIGSATGSPVGFSITTIDSGAAVARPETAVIKLDGTTITPKSAVKTGINTVYTWYDLAVGQTIGSTHTVNLSVQDTIGRTVTENRSYTVADYVTLPPSYAVTGVNTAQRGFNVKVHQTLSRDQATTVARAEQQLQGLRGANVIDQTQAGFSGGVYTEPAVINYNQLNATFAVEQNGAFFETATDPAFAIADVQIPGHTGSNLNTDGSPYSDNMAAEITTYIRFPEAGVYSLIFNSDDGFRTTAYNVNKEVLTSLVVQQADVGKGSSDVTATVYVPTAGDYAFRTVWFEGGGGANLEWSASEQLPTATARFLVNQEATGSLKSYRSATGGSSLAAVSFVHPFRNSGNAYLPTLVLSAKIEDGTSPVDQASVKLLLDGAEVTPTVSKSGTTTSLSFDPAGDLAGGNHEMVIRFTAGAQSYDGTNAFSTIALPSVPPSLALPAAAVNTANSGFLIKTFQSANGDGGGTDTDAGERRIHGLLGGPNIATLTAFTGPNSSYVETAVINYNTDEVAGHPGVVDSGLFTLAGAGGIADKDVPGTPGTRPTENGNGTDNFTVEALTVLDLQPGVYSMNVNSDDGFRVTFGNPSEWWTLPFQVGEFSGGRGNGAGINDGTTFYFRITQAGLYPARLMYYEGGGGANVEWSTRSVDENTGYISNPILINDRATAGHIKAYQYPVTSAGSPYVKGFSPARNRNSAASVGRVGPHAKITATIVEGTATIDTAAVSLKVDGAAMTPVTATKAGGEVSVSFTPATPWAVGNHDVVLTYGDRSVAWTFNSGTTMETPTFFIEAEDFDNAGAPVAAASQMPYSGAAYAGLSATAADYSRGNEASSPLYRIGEDPQVPMDITGDRDRGLVDIKVNYKLGWMGAPNWFNYTRTFPAGSYNVYAAISHGDGPTSGTMMGGNLQNVTGGASDVLGAFLAPATGGWGNNALLPLKDAATTNTMVAIPLSGTATLRFNSQNGDWDYMLLVPAGTAQPKIDGITTVPGGKLKITWSGAATLQSSPTLPATSWTDVTGAVSGGELTAPATGGIYYRLKQ